MRRPAGGQQLHGSGLEASEAIVAEERDPDAAHGVDGEIMWLCRKLERVEFLQSGGIGNDEGTAVFVGHIEQVSFRR